MATTVLALAKISVGREEDAAGERPTVGFKDSLILSFI